MADPRRAAGGGAAAADHARRADAARLPPRRGCHKGHARRRGGGRTRTPRSFPRGPRRRRAAAGRRRRPRRGGGHRPRRRPASPAAVPRLPLASVLEQEDDAPPKSPERAASPTGRRQSRPARPSGCVRRHAPRGAGGGGRAPPAMAERTRRRRRSHRRASARARGRGAAVVAAAAIAAVQLPPPAVEPQFAVTPLRRALAAAPSRAAASLAGCATPSQRCDLCPAGAGAGRRHRGAVGRRSRDECSAGHRDSPGGRVARQWPLRCRRRRGARRRRCDASQRVARGAAAPSAAHRPRARCCPRDSHRSAGGGSAAVAAAVGAAARRASPPRDGCGGDGARRRRRSKRTARSRSCDRRPRAVRRRDAGAPLAAASATPRRAGDLALPEGVTSAASPRTRRWQLRAVARGTAQRGLGRRYRSSESTVKRTWCRVN